MNDESRAYTLEPGEGLKIGDGSQQAWLKAGNVQSGGAFNFHYSETSGPLAGTPLHTHLRDDECALVIEGEFEVICGSRHYHLAPGSFVYLPRGVPHAIRPLTATKAVYVISPGVGSENLRTYLAAGTARGLSLEDSFRTLPPEMELEVVGPAAWSEQRQ